MRQHRPPISNLVRVRPPCCQGSSLGICGDVRRETVSEYLYASHSDGKRRPRGVFSAGCATAFRERIEHGMVWGGLDWDGVGWDGMGLNGMGRGELGWDRMGWKGKKRSGMGWDGMRWDGALTVIGAKTTTCDPQLH